MRIMPRPSLLPLAGLMAAACALAPVGAVAQDDVDASYFPRNSEQLRALVAECDTDDCMSYVSGAIGGIAAYALLADNPSPFCTRGEVSREAIRDAIVETIDTTPELDGQHPAIAILTAFGRYWPCLDDAQVSALKTENATDVAPETIEALADTGTAAITKGPDADAAHGTISVFHDPNCGHCQRFRAETDRLAEMGWRIVVYPVATISEQSAGYGAVEIALRDAHPEAAEALYRHDTDGQADITTAIDVARAAGLDQGTVLTAIARAGAYDAVERNTELFFAFGAKGTPAFYADGHVYSGFVDAATIDRLLGSEAADNAPDAAAPTARPDISGTPRDGSDTISQTP